MRRGSLDEERRERGLTETPDFNCFVEGGGGEECLLQGQRFDGSLMSFKGDQRLNSILVLIVLPVQNGLVVRAAEELVLSLVRMDEGEGFDRSGVAGQTGQMFSLVVPQMHFRVVTSDENGVAHRSTLGDPVVVHQRVFRLGRAELLQVLDFHDGLEERLALRLHMFVQRQTNQLVQTQKVQRQTRQHFIRNCNDKSRG